MTLQVAIMCRVPEQYHEDKEFEDRTRKAVTAEQWLQHGRFSVKLGSGVVVMGKGQGQRLELR